MCIFHEKLNELDRWKKEFGNSDSDVSADEIAVAALELARELAWSTCSCN